mmetsp:Transcript_56299/g.138289  ORF Transcript_56299/g.138289 Transcript_56299/m.138289 type:complete len:309 (-) Transcript_56299:57-983(-)
MVDAGRREVTGIARVVEHAQRASRVARVCVHERHRLRNHVDLADVARHALVAHGDDPVGERLHHHHVGAHVRRHELGYGAAVRVGVAVRRRARLWPPRRPHVGQAAKGLRTRVVARRRVLGTVVPVDGRREAADGRADHVDVGREARGDAVDVVEVAEAARRAAGEHERGAGGVEAWCEEVDRRVDVVGAGKVQAVRLVRRRRATTGVQVTRAVHDEHHVPVAKVVVLGRRREREAVQIEFARPVARRAERRRRALLAVLTRRAQAAAVEHHEPPLRVGRRARAPVVEAERRAVEAARVRVPRLVEQL